MSLIGDHFIGSADLPHVYCKKILVERDDAADLDSLDPNPRKITLNLVLYEEANFQSKSSGWLKQFITSLGGSEAGLSILDYMYLHVQPTSRTSYLKPSHISTHTHNSFKEMYDSAELSCLHSIKHGHPYTDCSTDAMQSLGNVYTAHTFLKLKNMPNIWWPYYINDDNKRSSWYQGAFGLRHSISLSKDSSLSGVSIDQAHDKGQISQEVINGKSYYVIPYQITFRTKDYYSYDDQASLPNLGFMFYTFLDIKGFFDDLVSPLGIDVNLVGDSLSQHMIQGPVNTEIIYENSDLTQKREEFFLPDGQMWEGPVHLHYCGINSDPTGYCGDGSFGPNMGWMVGKDHIMNPSSPQPRLNLQQYSNYKIHNFATKTAMIPVEDNYGAQISLEEAKSQAYKKWVTDTGKFFSDMVSPHQKETRKNFIKDNDSEYSKLFLTRDFTGAARGFFFINFKELLKNNSILFPNINFIEGERDKIISKSHLIELKVFRDRVNKYNPNLNNQEKFNNDSLFEEPSTLIGSISNEGTFGSIKRLSGFDSTQKYGFFTFHDLESANLTAGKYQYRIEIRYKDGTYKHLKWILKLFEEIETEMKRYHNLSMGSFSEESLINQGLAPGGLNWTKHLQGEDGAYKQKYFTSYYDEYLGFSSKFQEEVDLVFDEEWYSSDSTFTVNHPIWNTAMYTMWSYLEQLLPGGTSIDGNMITPDMFTMCHPATGSPEGIEFVIKTIRSVIGKIQSLIGLYMGSSAGADLTANNLDAIMSVNVNSEPASSIISEHHSYDDRNSLFTVSSTKGVWVDYLTKGLGNLGGYGTGLKEITAEDYVSRCIDDAQKFITAPAMVGPNGELKYAPVLESYIYRFLTPSIVHYMDPSATERRVFDHYSSVAVEDQTDFPAILIRFADYIKKDLDTEFSDIIEPFSGIQSFPGHSTREASKDLIESLNITIHADGLYEKFFNKRPGAVNKIIKDSDEYYEKGAPDRNTSIEWSDGYEQTAGFTINFCRSRWQSILKMGDLVTSTMNENGPLGYYLASLHPNDGALQQVGQQYSNNMQKMMAGKDTDIHWRSYAFFNFNMSVHVERLAPPVGPAKDTAGSWIPLTKSYLDSLADGRRVFCRVRPWSMRLTEGAGVPVLDKYFLISKGLPVAHYSGFSSPLLGGNRPLPSLFKRTIEDLDNIKKLSKDRSRSTQGPDMNITRDQPSVQARQTTASRRPGGAATRAVTRGTTTRRNRGRSGY